MRKSHAKLLPLLFLILFFPFNVLAWNSLGHMVIAAIAYENLEPNVRDKVDMLVSHLQQEYPYIVSFQQIASWPDALRSQHIETFTHWHYVDTYFSLDGTPITVSKDTDNAVWALDRIKRVIKNEKANPYERARFLAFLVHIVGDIHQPLHTVALVSQAHPKGDMGGNLYYVRWNNRKIKLHSLWDSGLGVFGENPTTDRSALIANKITAIYTKKYFGDRAKDVASTSWTKEGMVVAKDYVYSTREEETLSQHYLDNGRSMSQQQAALAGYRLAGLLNELLKKA